MAEAIRIRSSGLLVSARALGDDRIQSDRDLGGGHDPTVAPRSYRENAYTPGATVRIPARRAAACCRTS